MIIDPVVDPGDIASRGLGISPGGVAVGKSLASRTARGPSPAAWSSSTTSPADRSTSQRANDMAGCRHRGLNLLRFSALPVIWNGSTASQLPLPAGESVGRAGISTTTASPSARSVAARCSSRPTGHQRAQHHHGHDPGRVHGRGFAVNDAGQVVGHGIDPNNAARNVGLMFDITTGVIYRDRCSARSERHDRLRSQRVGRRHGFGSFNQTGGLAFTWDATNGASEIPAGATTASGRDANSNGWVVGNAGGQFAVPRLFDGCGHLPHPISSIPTRAGTSP